MGIVLTHDCSISGKKISAEPDLEIVFARVVERPDGNLTKGKNPRKLHLEVNNNGVSKWLEINICQRKFLNKREFDSRDAAANWNFSEENKRLIRQWLAARYQAPAYPDNYEKRLRIDALNKRIETLCAGEAGALLHGIYLILDPRYDDLPPDQPYELQLMLLVKTGLSDEQINKVKKLRKDLVDLLRGHREHLIHLVGDGAGLTQQQVEELIRIEDTSIPHDELSQYDLMRLDHLSEGRNDEPVRPLMN